MELPVRAEESAAEAWLLLGPGLDQAAETAALVRAFEARMPGRWQTYHTDRLLLALIDGELRLYDTRGCRVAPPRVVYARLSTPALRTDREITLLHHLDLMGAIVVNPIAGILAAVNKFWHLQRFAMAQLPVPDTVTFTTADAESLVALVPEAEPYVVKSVRGHRGEAVFLASSQAALSDLTPHLDAEVPFLVQDYVATSHGRDLRVFVVDGRAVNALRRTSRDGSLTANVHQGGDAVPCFGAYPRAEALAVQAADAAGLTVAGVDLLFDGDTFTLCEVNSNTAWLADDTTVPNAIADCIARRIPT